MGKFWMIYVEGTGGFGVKHETEDVARSEAERLARLPDNRCRKVYILETIGFCQTEYPPVVFYEIGG